MSSETTAKGVTGMWPGFDPELRRQLDNIRTMVGLSHQTPTTEWPLTFVAEHDALLVIREWPGGVITAYATSVDSDRIGGKGDRPVE